MKKPSKKIIILSVVALAIVLLAVFDKWFQSEAKPNLVTPEVITANTESNLATDTFTSASVLDTDKDELPDWQEALWGTNPENPDTDNDGTRDGVEVKNDRNPTVAGPNDTSKPFEISTKEENSTTDNTPKTVSEAVARNLFASTVYLSNNDNINEDSTAALVENMLQDVEGSFTFKQYDALKMQFIDSSNKKAILSFATEFANIQKAMLIEMQSAIKVEANSSEELSLIYTRQADKMYSMKVPRELTLEQLNIVNNFSKAGVVFDAMAKQKEDPVKTMFAIRAYQDIGVSQEASIMRMGTFLRANDIIKLMDEDTLNYWVLFLTEQK